MDFDIELPLEIKRIWTHLPLSAALKYQPLKALFCAMGALSN